MMEESTVKEKRRDARGRGALEQQLDARGRGVGGEEIATGAANFENRKKPLILTNIIKSNL